VDGNPGAEHEAVPDDSDPELAGLLGAHFRSTETLAVGLKQLVEVSTIESASVVWDHGVASPGVQRVETWRGTIAGIGCLLDCCRQRYPPDQYFCEDGAGGQCRKEDYRFQTEPRTDQERQAPAAAVAWAAGREGLVDR
jgi:hypothetical protein